MGQEAPEVLAPWPFVFQSIRPQCSSSPVLLSWDHGSLTPICRLFLHPLLQDKGQARTSVTWLPDSWSVGYRDPLVLCPDLPIPVCFISTAFLLFLRGSPWQKMMSRAYLYFQSALGLKVKQKLATSELTQWIKLLGDWQQKKKGLMTAIRSWGPIWWKGRIICMHAWCLSLSLYFSLPPLPPSLPLSQQNWIIYTVGNITMSLYAEISYSIMFYVWSHSLPVHSISALEVRISVWHG